MLRIIIALLLSISSLYGKNIVLVAGGAGFLGSHLCERLVQEGKYVVCLDNFSSGNMDNVKHLSDNLMLIEGDVCTLAVPEFSYSEIYNLACPASPPKYQKDPIKTLDTNYIGTKNLLELARSCNAVFFQASTSEIYGDPLEHPQTEEYWGNANPHGPRSCYDEGKRIAETLCFEYHWRYNVPIKVVRIFNTYGPRMAPDDGRVVTNFICQALTGEPLTLYGDGSQTRSFCYVDDLISGFIAMMRTPKDFTGPINLGNPSEITVRTLAEMILKLTKSKSEIICLPKREDDPSKRRPDIRKAEEQLNWYPHVSLKLGLEATIEYFNNL